MDAQKHAILNFCDANRFDIIAHFEEVASGGDDHRQELQRAIAFAKKNNAVLVVAKVCRLSRKVSFVSGLIDNGLKCYVVDLGPRLMDPFTLQLMSIFAENERRLIKERTKAALARKKAAGYKLGNENILEIREIGQQKIKDNAKAFALGLEAMVRPTMERMSLADVATILNSTGVSTRRGGKWHASTVRNLAKYW